MYKRIVAVIFFVIFFFLVGKGVSEYLKNQDDLTFNGSYFVPYFKSKILKMCPDCQIEIESAYLVWRKQEESFAFVTEGVSVVDKKSQFKLLLPKTVMSSKIGLMFLWTNFNFTSIQIDDPTIIMNQSNSTEIDITSIPEEVRGILVNSIKYDFSAKIRNINIIAKDQPPLIISKIEMRKERSYDHDALSIFLQYSDFKMNASLSGDYRGMISFATEYQNLPLSLLEICQVPVKYFFLDKNNKISGKFEIKINEQNKIFYSNVKIKSVGDPLDNHNNKFVGGLLYKDRLLNMNMRFDDTTLSAKGRLLSSNTVSLTVDVDGLEATKLCAYWPEQLHIKSRNWYCENILHGKIENISLITTFDISNFPQVSSSQHKIQGLLNDIDVKFSDNLPLARKINGYATFENNNLMINVRTATFQDIENIKGTVTIHDIGDKSTKLSIHASSDSSAKDMYTSIENITQTQIISGPISGKASSELEFVINNLNNEDEASNHSLKITSHFSDLQALEVYGVIDIYNTNLDLILENKTAYIQGEGFINDKAARLKLEHHFHNNESLKCDFSGFLSASNLKDTIPFDGLLNSNIHYETSYIGLNKVSGTANLAHAKINVPYTNWLIDHEDSANLSFSSHFDTEHNIIIDQATLTGKSIDVQLTGNINQKKEEISLSFSKFKLLDNDFYANINVGPQSIKIKVSGQSANLSQFSLPSFANNTLLSKAIEATVLINSLKMKNDIMIYESNLELNYTQEGYCLDSSFSGVFQDQSFFQANCSKIGIDISSNNAGYLLQAFGISNYIKGGKMSFYFAPPQDGMTPGMLSLTKFYIVKSPILAKMLTLSSLPGIVNVLNGKGVYFNNINVPFIYIDRKIAFKESWLEGTDLGISVGGNIDLTTKKFDITGQIIPLYVINKTIWKIPVLGKLLTGGKSRGVISADYDLRGAIENYDLSVDFMSILTPTLLKKVLELFDDKVADEADSRRN